MVACSAHRQSSSASRVCWRKTTAMAFCPGLSTVGGRFRPRARIQDAGALAPLGPRFRLDAVARGQALWAFLAGLDGAPHCRRVAGAAVEYLSHRSVRNSSPENILSLIGTVHLGGRGHWRPVWPTWAGSRCPNGNYWQHIRPGPAWRPCTTCRSGEHSLCWKCY